MKGMIEKTLMDLANAANGQASELMKRKNPTKAKQFYAIQTKLAQAATSLNTTAQAIGNFEDDDPSLEALLVEVLECARKDMDYVLAAPDKLANALINPTFNLKIVQFNNILNGIKRNLELREIFKALMQSEQTDERIFNEKRQAYAKQVAQDVALITVLRNTPVNLGVKLEESNQQWAKMLKEKFNVQNLPENKQQEAAKTDGFGFGKLIATFFDGLCDLFKGLANSDGTEESFKIPMMNFMNKVIPSVFGMLGSLFKGFFGGTTEEKDKKADDLSKDMTHFFTKQFAKPSTPSNLPNDFTPMFNMMNDNLRRAAKSRVNLPTTAIVPFVETNNKKQNKI